MIAIVVLDVDTAAYIDIEGHMFALFLHLCHNGEQGAVATARIDLFPFKELSVFDALLEIIHGQKIVFTTVHFLATGRACGGRNGKSHFGDVGHDVVQ